MLFSARIKELEGQLSALTSERDTLQLSVTELTTANADCETRHAADQASILAATGERDSAQAQLGTVTAERDQLAADLAAERTGREAAINTQVTQRLADAGAAPIQRDPATTDPAAPSAAASPVTRLAALFK